MLRGQVTITGSAVVGDTLSASFDGAHAGTLTYTWKDGSTTLGTGTSYTLTESEEGKVLTVVVTDSVESGSVSANTEEIAPAPEV